MRILQTPARLYPYVGGVEKLVLSLSRALVELGHEVTVVCADEPTGGPLDLDGVQIRRLWYPMKIANTNLTPELPLYLMRERFDIVHTHLPTPWTADWSAMIGRARGKGVVLGYYNEIVGTGAAREVAHLYNALCLPLTLQLAHRIVVESGQVLGWPGSPLQAQRDKVRVVYTGVDSTRLFPRPELRVAGTVGFLAVLDEYHRYKGLDVLLMAAQQLLRLGRNFRLRIGGEGALRPEYEQIVRRLGLEERVQFVGLVAESFLSDHLNRCDMLILPTTEPEGYGNVALEAMACGLPVVVTSAAGIAEVVSSRNAGLVIPPGDVGALVNAIEQLLAKPALASHLGSQGRKAVEAEFSWKAVARQYERIYRECIVPEPSVAT
jgi:glycosyltransferase involved in cell wall biosynthesis